MLPQPRRRWAFFPRSVISDHDNPAAHLYRAMARKIADIDDEARFYEERANPWLRNMLLEQGAAGFRAFQERHPDITYVTYERREGHQLAEWLTLALATVDIVVVDYDIPQIIQQWIGELTRPRLHTFLVDPEGGLSLSEGAPDFLPYYRGICVSQAHSAPVTLHESQYLINFGPALPEPGQNGSALRHVEATASNLVDQLVEAVDETLAQQNRDSHPNAE